MKISYTLTKWLQQTNQGELELKEERDNKVSIWALLLRLGLNIRDYKVLVNGNPIQSHNTLVNSEDEIIIEEI